MCNRLPGVTALIWTPPPSSESRRGGTSGSAPMPHEPLGLDSGAVVVLPYDSRWPALFEQATEELRRTIGSEILEVHHVGSTAVPGLCAKPILDILVSIPGFERGVLLVPALEELGYRFRPDEEIPDRHYFCRRNGTRRTHHLSLAEPASRYHAVTLAFRDALRSHPELASRYAALKQQLATKFPTNREAYIDGKSKFVADVLARVGTRDGAT